MSAFRGKNFKKIQKEWYDKLKKEGFEDIEDVHEKTEYIRIWHSSYFQTKYHPQVFEAKRTYYELAGQFLEASPHFRFELYFQCEIEKTIWEMHAQGIPVRTIAKKLKAKVCQIHKIIVQIRKVMMESQ